MLGVFSISRESYFSYVFPKARFPLTGFASCQRTFRQLKLEKQIKPQIFAPHVNEIVISSGHPLQVRVS